MVFVWQLYFNGNKGYKTWMGGKEMELKNRRQYGWTPVTCGQIFLYRE